MADVRPLAGLRYDIPRAGSLAELLAPPYDVIDATQRQALADRSPHNIVRVELASPAPGDEHRPERYADAAATLQRWRHEGILVRDGEERFYRYLQQFEFEGEGYSRLALMSRVRLTAWGPGAVLPHEHTRPHDKADRLALLRAVRTNVSPVFLLFRDPGHVVRDALAVIDEVLEEARGTHGMDQLAAVEGEQARRLQAFLASQTLYVADGHHRYETALGYCEERRRDATGWTGEEAENFVLGALVASDDPGLLVRPTHRLVRPSARVFDPVGQLGRHFDVSEVACEWDVASLAGTAAERLRAAEGQTAFVAIGMEPGKAHLLVLRDPSIDALLPQDKPPAWRALDVSILQFAVLGSIFGVDERAAAGGQAVAYTADIEKAVRSVLEGEWPLAFLLNPTPVEAVLEVADEGSRMPQKSTYFYPKLATGLVLNPFD